MADLYGLQASGLPPELVAKLSGVSREQQIAQALLEQSMKAPEAGAVKGRFQGVVNPMEYVGKVVQGLLANKDLKRADQGMAGIASEKQQALADAMMKMQGIERGVEAKPPLTPNDDEGNPMPMVPGTPGNPQGAAEFAATNPMLSGTIIPKMAMDRVNKGIDREDKQAEKRDELKAKMEARKYEVDRAMEDKALSREQVDALKREGFALQERIAKMADDSRRENNASRADTARMMIDMRRGQDRPRLKPGERYDEATGTVVPIEGSDLYRNQSDKHAKDSGALNAINTKTEGALKKIGELIGPDPSKPTPAKGFDNHFGGYTAYGTRLLPGETQNVGTKIESLKSDMKAAGLEMIRAGGSIGQMTEREWPIVQDMISKIDPRMGVDAAVQAFNEIRAYMNRIRSNAADVYQTEWGNSVFSKKKASSAPAEGGSPDEPPPGAVRRK